MFELEDNKEIITTTKKIVEYCEQEITYICENQIKRAFIHDKKIKEIANLFNLNINNAEKIYTAVRYYEIQP